MKQIRFNDDAERAVLGCVLIEPMNFDEIGPMLQSGDFFAPQHQTIWKAMHEVAKGSRIDFATLKHELTRQGKLESVGGDDYLLDLGFAVGSSANAAHYGAIVAEEAAARRMRDAFAGAARSIDEGGKPDDALAIFEHKREQIGGRLSLSANVGQIADSLGEQPEIEGVTTGIEALNSLTGQGWPKGSLSIMTGISKGGRSAGSGKTIFGLQAFAAAIEAGHRAMFATFGDLSGAQIVRRLLKQTCGFGGRPRYQLDRLPDYEDALSGFTDAFGPWRENAVIYEGLKQGRCIEDLLVEAEGQRRAKGLDLLVLDYLQLVRSRFTRREERTRTMEEISDQLVTWAGRTNCAVLALTQTTIQDKEGRRMVRYGGDVENDAALYFSLERGEGDDAKWQVDKNRYGPDDVAGTCHFDSGRLKFIHWQVKA